MFFKKGTKKASNGADTGDSAGERLLHTVPPSPACVWEPSSTAVGRVGSGWVWGPGAGPSTVGPQARPGSGAGLPLSAGSPAAWVCGVSGHP